MRPRLALLRVGQVNRAGQPHYPVDVLDSVAIDHVRQAAAFLLRPGLMIAGSELIAQAPEELKASAAV